MSLLKPVSFRALHLILILLGTGISEKSPGQDISSRLAKTWSDFESDPQLRYAVSSLVALDARNGNTIFSRNGDIGLATASTLKVITSVTAFNLLGENYTYETQVGYTGKIGPDGVLHGDIIIRGAGDPTLGSWRWQNTREETVLVNWVSAVKQKGVKRIEGRIIGDQRLMGTQTLPGGWQWDDIGNYYGAGASALNWRENQFDILLQPTAVGGPVRLTGTKPDMGYLEFVNELQTGAGGTGDQAYVYLPPYRNIAYLRGTYAIDQQERSISAAIPDPAYECAYRFRQALEKEGIPVSGEACTSRQLELKGADPAGTASHITTSTSPSLDKIIYWFNRKSINLYGESLLKTIAVEAGKRGGTEAGVRVVRDFWAKKGIDTNSLAIYDGSGLNPSNRVTGETMGRILLSARKEPWFSSFYSSLPEQNGMRMKSGYIQGVRAYAGYHTGREGVPCVFVFIVNNFSGSPSEMRLKMWRVLDVLK